ncbi:MAG: hypothetical protein ACRC3H_01865 [Lachnospiraceae bacterium]
MEFLKINQSANLRNVVLTHLSEHNADPDHFREAAGKVVNCPVHIVKKGLEIDVGLPFANALVGANLPELCTNKRKPNCRTDRLETEETGQLRFA